MKPKPTTTSVRVSPLPPQHLPSSSSSNILFQSEWGRGEVSWHLPTIWGLCIRIGEWKRKEGKGRMN